MPEIINVIRRPRQTHKKVIPLPIPKNRSWHRNFEDPPIFDAVNLNGIEFCVGCGEKMTVARSVAWLRDGQGFLYRQGPCHPSCREMAQNRFPHHELVFQHPNFLGKASA